MNDFHIYTLRAGRVFLEDLVLEVPELPCSRLVNKALWYVVNNETLRMNSKEKTILLCGDPA